LKVDDAPEKLKAEPIREPERRERGEREDQQEV
jgi:hypothetical protein